MDARRDGLIAFHGKMIDHDDEDEYAFRIVEESLAESDELPRPIHSESQSGRSPNLLKDRKAWNQRMINNHFSENPLFGIDIFRCFFRIQRSLFLKIMDVVCKYDPYFDQRRDAIGALGLSLHHKCKGALPMLAYGVSIDASKEYCRTGKSTAIESMKRHIAPVCVIFGYDHLQEPTQDDFEQQLCINAD